MKLWILSIILLTVNASAATYYIDFASGSDASSGTSKSTPWKHAPGMSGSTISGYSHSAGDKFIFKGGVTWDSSCFQWAITSGGSSAGNRDYYGVDQTWFTGGSWARPTMDCGYVPCTTHRILVQAAYVEIDNFEIKHILASNLSLAPSLISWFPFAGGLVTNCYIHGWKTTATSDSAYGGFNVGTSGAPTDLTLDHSEIENSENKNVLTTGSSTTSATIGSGNKTFAVTGGLSVTAGQYVQVWNGGNNCIAGYVTSYTGGSLVINATNVFGSGTYSNWTVTGPYTASGQATRCVAIIQNSSIHDVSSAVHFPIDFNSSQLYNVTGDTFDIFFHQNGIYLLSSAYSPAAANCYVRNSYLHDTYLGANTIYANPNQNGTMWAYNNVIYGKQTAQGCVEIQTDQFGTTPGTFIGYNNTIAVSTGAQAAFHVAIYAGTKLNVLTLYNNHVINAASLTDSNSSNTTTYTNGNNLLQSTATATAQGYVLGNLYAPTSGGSTIDAGTSITATLTSDILADSRVQGGVWDIGAYEYSTSMPVPGGPPTVSPPSNATIKIQTQ